MQIIQIKHAFLTFKAASGNRSIANEVPKYLTSSTNKLYFCCKDIHVQITKPNEWSIGRM